MSKEKKVKKKDRIMWGFIYVFAFIAAFGGSIAFKKNHDPFKGEFKVNWNDSVGRGYTNIAYGEDEANKFDLYVPADASRDSYGLKEIKAEFGTPEYNEEIKDISALLWINENTVPTLVAYGKYDKVQPYEGSQRLLKALKDNHVPYDYYLFEHSGHGLQNDNKVYGEYMRKILEYLDMYMPVK